MDFLLTGAGRYILTATGFEQPSPQILFGAPLMVDLLERLLSLRIALRLTMGGGRYRVVASGALLQRLFAIGCRELNFKLMDLIPLRIRTLALRYREKLLQAAAG